MMDQTQSVKVPPGVDGDAKMIGVGAAGSESEN